MAEVHGAQSRRRVRARSAWLVAVALVATALVAPRAGADRSPAERRPPATPGAPRALEAWGHSADIQGPNGLYVGGPKGLIYQGGVFADEIDVVDPHNGKVLDRIGAERGVHGPDDIYVTPDGTIYWTEIFGGNVGRLTPDGKWRLQKVALGVNPIAMNAQGRLFTALDFLGNGLYELDPELIKPPKLLLADIDTLNGFTFGPDGYLYGPLFFQHKVVKINVDATPPTVETVADGFRVPSGVEFDSKGRMVVTDFAEGQAIRIDLATGKREVVLDIPGIFDNSAVGPDDTVYSAAFADGAIWAASPSGKVRQVTNSGIIAAGGVAVDTDGSVVLGDWFSIKRFAKGNQINTIYDRFDPAGQGPTGANSLSLSGKNLITTNYFSNVLQVIDGRSGAVVQDVRDLKTPTNAIVHGSDIAVAQAGSANGTGPGSVVKLSDRSVLIDGLTLPTGLASNGTTLYVADWTTGSVWSTGTSGMTLVAAGFNHPEGLALTADGKKLLVVEEGIDQVTSLDLTTGDRRVAAKVALGDHYPPGLQPYGQFNGIAVAPDGTFWVSSDIDNVLYHYARPA